MPWETSDKGGCPRRRGGPGPICSQRLRKPICISILSSWLGEETPKDWRPRRVQGPRDTVQRGVNRAWQPGVKVKSQPSLLGVHFLSQHECPQGCPRTEAWPGSPPPARPPTSLLGGPGGPGVEVLGGAPLGPEACPAVRLAFPAVPGNLPRAGGPELSICMQSSILIPSRWSEVSQTQPFGALRVPSNFFFFFGGCTGPQSRRFLGDMSAR